MKPPPTRFGPRYIRPGTSLATISSPEPTDLIKSMSYKTLRCTTLTDAPVSTSAETSPLCACVTLAIGADFKSSFYRLVTKVNAGPHFLRLWEISCNVATFMTRVTHDFGHRNQWSIGCDGIPDAVPPINWWSWQGVRLKAPQCQHPVNFDRYTV